MVNADGEWVVAEPDQASWEQFRTKAKVSATAQEVAARGSKELQNRGLECSIDKRLFVEPTRTPCCQTTYCNECITNTLLDNDFQCPSCGKDGILIDDLIPDNDMVTKIRSFEKEKSEEREQEKPKSPTVKQEVSTPTSTAERKSKSPSAIRPSSSLPPTSITDGNPKKRPADAELNNTHHPPGPSQWLLAVKAPSNTPQQTASDQTTKVTQDFSSIAQMPFSNSSFVNTLGMNSMTLPNGNILNGNSMTMGPIMGMSTGMVNPMMMMPNNAFTSGFSNWGNMDPTAFPQYNGMYGGNYQGDMIPNLAYGSPNGPMQLGNGVTGMIGVPTFNQGAGPFVNQQRTRFNSSQPNEEDSAYFRKPVNPHRHQSRRNMSRPTDYREI